jgi:hypothetical protein
VLIKPPFLEGYRRLKAQLCAKKNNLQTSALLPLEVLSVEYLSMSIPIQRQRQLAFTKRRDLLQKLRQRVMRLRDFL